MLHIRLLKEVAAISVEEDDSTLIHSNKHASFISETDQSSETPIIQGKNTIHMYKNQMFVCLSTLLLPFYRTFCFG